MILLTFPVSLIVRWYFEMNEFYRQILVFVYSALRISFWIVSHVYVSFVHYD